jgi:hypothetical protein
MTSVFAINQTARAHPAIGRGVTITWFVFLPKTWNKMNHVMGDPFVERPGEENGPAFAPPTWL